MNLCSVSFSPFTIKTLSKESKFTPTLKIFFPKIEKNIKEFTRYLKLIGFLSDEENPDYDMTYSSLVKYKS